MPDLKRLSKQTTQSILRQYVQNLYRFFKLSIYKKEFVDPFTQSLNLLSEAILIPKSLNLCCAAL